MENNFTLVHEVNRIIERLNSLCDKPILPVEDQGKIKQGTVEGLVSIIIQVSDNPVGLKKCFQSVKRHTSESHEIIFVHNGATKKINKWLKGEIKKNSGYHLIGVQKTENLSSAINSGIEKSSGEHILLLSDNVVVTKEWLSGMLDCLKWGPDAGVAVPMSNFARGIQKVPTANHISMDLLDAFAGAFRDRNRFRRIPSSSIHGFCMLFARDLVYDIGLFDENQGGYAGEDFCLRANLEGYTNFIAGDVYVHQQREKNPARDRKHYKRKWNKEDDERVSEKKRAALDAIEEAWNVYHRGSIDDAVEILLESLKLSPDHKPTYYCLGDLLINAKQYKDALDVIREMPQGDRDVKIVEMIGYCEEGMELDQEALRHADHALSIKNNSAVALNLKGILSFKQGETESAEDYFKKAIEADPGYGEPYTNLGAIRWESKPEDALNLFERGFILSPTTPDVLSNYHSAITAAGEFIRAVNVFEDACFLYPNCKILRYRFIDVLFKLEKNEQAIEQIEKVLVLYGVDDGILPAALKIRELLGPKEINEQMKQKNTVSLCMIVKNEEEYLAKCLGSVKPVVDEMIVVDTGSTDRTRDIAAIFGAKIYDFKWADDFSEARNYSIKMASGSWTFHLDADEAISPLDYDKFRRVIRQAGARDAAFSINTRNYSLNVNLVDWVANDGKYELEESGNGWTPSEKVRLFRNYGQIRFDYPVHELVSPSLEKAGIVPKKCRIPVHHYGKLDERKTLDKSESYYQIGKNKLDEMGDDQIALRELAIQAQLLDKHEESVELWKRFIAIAPDESRAYINIGVAYCSMGKFKDVLETAKKAMELAPHRREAHYNYALAKLHLGDVRKAAKSLEELLAREDEYPVAQFLLAVVYCCNKEVANGINALKGLQRTSIGPSLPMRCYEFARTLIVSQRYEYALLLLESAIEGKISNKKMLELHAKCLEVTKEVQRPTTNQEDSKVKPQSQNRGNETVDEMLEQTLLNQAWELVQKGRVDDAIEVALETIGKFPSNKRPYYFLARILIDTQLFKDALDVLNEMPPDEKDEKWLALAGYSMEGMKQYGPAEDYANQALLIDPSSAPALNLKGLLAYHQGDIPKAEGFFKQALQSDPEYGDAYTSLGSIRWEHKQDEALALFEKGFTFSPEVADAINNYHTAVVTLGEFERAETVFEAMVKKCPNSKLIQYRLIDLLIKQEKYARAMEQTEYAIGLFGVDDGVLDSALKIRGFLGPKEIDKSGDHERTVSLCMIVKDEEACLSGCLNSVKSIVDEMIIVDTGSTDRTKDMAKAFGAKVYDFEWGDDFSEARNYSISKARGKWIFCLDADEVISTLDHEAFGALVENSHSKPVAYVFTTRNYSMATNMVGWQTNEKKYEKENAGCGWIGSHKARLFPNRTGIQFEYPVHELVAPSLTKSGIRIKKCDIPVHHYGKMNQGKKAPKGELYYRIGRKKMAENRNSTRALYELGVQAGILGKHEDAIGLWEELLKIKPDMPMAFVSIASALSKLGKYEQAIQAAKKAIEIAPGIKEAHHNYAYALVHLGRVKEAISALEAPVKGLEKYPPAQFLLAVAYCLDKNRDGWQRRVAALRTSMGRVLGFSCCNFARGLISARRHGDAEILLKGAIESGNGNKEVDALYLECIKMR